MTDILDFQIYQLSGKDIPAFLQGQCTADITKIADGNIQLTGICNAKGRLVASPFLFYSDDSYYLAIESNMSDTLFSYWKPFLMLSRVKAAPIESDDMDAALTKHLNAIQQQSSFEACIEACLVLITPETSKLWMPMALNYETLGALSFQKGCYVGQEILARVHYKGKVTKKVMIAEFDSDIACRPGMLLTDHNEKSIGIIATAPINDLTNKALIVCSTQIAEHTLQIQFNGEAHQVTLNDITN